MGSLNQLTALDPSSTPGFRSRSYRNNPASPAAVFWVDVNAEYQLNGAALLVTDQLDIKLKILNVLATIIGEEWHEPLFGSYITHRLFEGVTKTTAYHLQTDVFVALDEQMKDEISLVMQGCIILEADDGEGYSITVTFIINETQAVGKITAYANSNTGFITSIRSLD